MSKKEFFEIKKLLNLTNDFDLLETCYSETSEAIEYGEKSIGFNVPRKSCSLGQLIKLEGFLHTEGKILPFEASGKIIELNPIGKTRIRILVELHTIDKILWKKFIDSFKKKVNETERLFAAMKGDE